MINTYVSLQEIRYNEVPVEESFVQSIKERGIAIAIKVNVHDGYYECIDGNKRLSALHILSREDKKYEKVFVMLMNDYSKAGSHYWGNTQNKH